MSEVAITTTTPDTEGLSLEDATKNVAQAMRRYQDAELAHTEASVELNNATRALSAAHRDMAAVNHRAINAALEALENPTVERVCDEEATASR